jgi:hypothetical protein
MEKQSEGRYNRLLPLFYNVMASYTSFLRMVCPDFKDKEL